MASGNTLFTLYPQNNVPPSSAFATPDLRGGVPVLDFDDTTAEAAVFFVVLPRNYAGGGITFYVTWAATSAITNTIGWTLEFERIGDGQVDIDSLSWTSVQTITAATVPGTSGNTKITNVAVSNGANMDSIAVGELFAIRLKRDVANDNATGDAEFLSMEAKET